MGILVFAPMACVLWWVLLSGYTLVDKNVKHALLIIAQGFELCNTNRLTYLPTSSYLLL